MDSTKTYCIPTIDRSLFSVPGEQNVAQSAFFILVPSFVLLCVEKAARPASSLISSERGKGASGGSSGAPALFSTQAKPRDQ